MDYDLKLQHKAGSKMIVTDALSQCADWLKGIDQDNVDVVTLPDALHQEKYLEPRASQEVPQGVS